MLFGENAAAQHEPRAGFERVLRQQLISEHGRIFPDPGLETRVESSELRPEPRFAYRRSHRTTPTSKPTLTGRCTVESRNVVEIELKATADTSGWSMTGPNRKPIPVGVLAVAGDSVVGRTRPDEQALRRLEATVGETAGGVAAAD
jgi:hypothetical protein